MGVLKLAECSRCGRAVQQEDIYQTKKKCKCGKVVEFER